MEDSIFFNIVASIPALLLVFGYFALGIFCARKVRAFTGEVMRPWVGTLLSTFVLAVFFAPGVIGFGTGTEAGVGPAPVWIMVLQNSDRSFFWDSVRWALISFSVTWAFFFIVGLLRAHAKAQRKQAENLKGRDQP